MILAQSLSKITSKSSQTLLHDPFLSFKVNLYLFTPYSITSIVHRLH